jgi:ketose-bisphosphate aldolase
MPLVSMTAMLATARREGWAVAAFNPVDYASAKAVVRAAHDLNAPVIAQTSAKTVNYYGATTIAGWMRELAGATPAPVALHLDHGKDLALIARCIEAGWTSVMIDASDKPFAENLALTRQVLALAAPKGVGVEAEIGEIGGVEEDIVVADSDAHYADVEQSLAFCRAANLAVFAPAIGTAHGVYKSEPRLAWSHLEAIGRGTSTPLALHGGTGLADDVIQRCIRLGCAKINISTNLKHVFIDSFIAAHQADPRYEPLAVLGAQAAAMQALVEEKIRQFGGAGKGPRVPSAA